MYIDEIQNYYKQLVHDEIYELLIINDENVSNDFLEDVACVALNQLPAKYVRHSVDLIFYMSAQEMKKMRESTKEAVAQAIETVRKHQEGPRGISIKKTSRRKKKA